MATNNKYKKRIRLKSFNYKGVYRYFVTICTLDEKQIFKDNDLVEWFIKVLKEKSKNFEFKVWAYCFMPDHLHLLVEGKGTGSDMNRFIKSYKQYTGFYYKRKFKNNLWQPNFYEHVLRNEEDTMKVAQYIFGNPIRKGLVNSYKDYKFLGSLEFDVTRAS